MTDLFLDTNGSEKGLFFVVSLSEICYFCLCISYFKMDILTKRGNIQVLLIHKYIKFMKGKYYDRKRYN